MVMLVVCASGRYSPALACREAPSQLAASSSGVPRPRVRLNFVDPRYSSWGSYIEVRERDTHALRCVGLALNICSVCHFQP